MAVVGTTSTLSDGVPLRRVLDFGADLPVRVFARTDSGRRRPGSPRHTAKAIRAATPVTEPPFRCVQCLSGLAPHPGWTSGPAARGPIAVSDLPPKPRDQRSSNRSGKLPLPTYSSRIAPRSGLRRRIAGPIGPAPVLSDGLCRLRLGIRSCSTRSRARRPVGTAPQAVDQTRGEVRHDQGHRDHLTRQHGDPILRATSAKLSTGSCGRSPSTGRTWVAHRRSEPVPVRASITSQSTAGAEVVPTSGAPLLVAVTR